MTDSLHLIKKENKHTNTESQTQVEESEFDLVGLEANEYFANVPLVDVKLFNRDAQKQDQNEDIGEDKVEKEEKVENDEKEENERPPLDEDEPYAPPTAPRLLVRDDVCSEKHTDRRIVKVHQTSVCSERLNDAIFYNENGRWLNLQKGQTILLKNQFNRSENGIYVYHDRLELVEEPNKDTCVFVENGTWREVYFCYDDLFKWYCPCPYMAHATFYWDTQRNCFAPVTPYRISQGDQTAPKTAQSSQNDDKDFLGKSIRSASIQDLLDQIQTNSSWNMFEAILDVCAFALVTLASYVAVNDLSIE